MSNEFVIETYQKWLASAKIFKIGPINVRVYAAQNTIGQMLSKCKIDRDDNKWHTDPIISDDVLNRIFECLEGIGDSYKATSAAHWIANR